MFAAGTLRLPIIYLWYVFAFSSAGDKRLEASSMGNRYDQALQQAETILSATTVDPSYLTRYQRLRELALLELHPAGDGTFKNRLKRAAQRLALAPAIRFNDALLDHLRKELLLVARSESRAVARPRLIYVAPFDVLSRNGGATRVLGLSRAFSRDFEVSILSVVGPHRALEVIPVSPGVAIYAIPQSEEFRRAVEKDAPQLGGAAFSLGLDRHRDALPMLSYWFRHLGADASVCVLNQPYLLHLWREAPGTMKLVYDVPEVNSFFTLRNAAGGTDLDAVRRQQADLERETCRSATVIGMCATADIKTLLAEQSETPTAKVALIPNGVWVDDNPYVPPSRSKWLREACGWSRQTAVFLGSPGYPPNLEAVRFIAETLAPRYSSTWFAILGMKKEDAGKTAAPPNISFCGRVSEPRKAAILAMADVALSPIGNYDSGSSLKIAEYVAHGKPVLATEFGLRGYEALLDFTCTCPLDDFASRFGEIMFRIQVSPDEIDAQCDAARKALKTHYDWSIIGGQYAKLFK
jgi:glycosyltransferase involved in cell wall biosynthesis